jgi:hypothetical protein
MSCVEKVKCQRKSLDRLLLHMVRRVTPVMNRRLIRKVMCGKAMTRGSRSSSGRAAGFESAGRGSSPRGSVFSQC